ncbi:MAG TPA: glycine cleavage system aminomethyltransferase GcvT [Acidimicrobiia bacterium]|nr:glycine cleavage system aminomethyltransferase GcvT [Acidimicrobiia bacterium]
MNRSPIHTLNDQLGARFVDFGGWEMPVQFSSILAEHRAVRDAAGVFDVSHLGRFELTGDGAIDAMARLLCNDIERVEPGHCQYTMALNEDGGIIDDLIVWWWEPARLWVMPNAANHHRVMDMFADQPDCQVEDLQGSTVFLAVQGPHAPAAIEKVLGEKPGRLRCLTVDWESVRVAMAGTGYTGEPGAEICAPEEVGEELMREFIDAGAVPSGLGARDTLRLESGFPLWGEDIDETTTPLEADLAFAVSMDHEFVGRESLVTQEATGLSRRLGGFVLDERGIPRHGHDITTSSGSTGTVTSGNLSPMLEKGVGLAYMSPPAADGDHVEVVIRGRSIPGRMVRPPFHKS